MQFKLKIHIHYIFTYIHTYMCIQTNVVGNKILKAILTIWYEFLSKTNNSYILSCYTKNLPNFSSKQRKSNKSQKMKSTIHRNGISPVIKWKKKRKIALKSYTNNFRRKQRKKKFFCERNFIVCFLFGHFMCVST